MFEDGEGLSVSQQVDFPLLSGLLRGKTKRQITIHADPFGLFDEAETLRKLESCT